MELFFFNLRRPNETPTLIGSCTIIGEPHRYSRHYREFNNEREAAEALQAAGIDRSRFEYLLARTRPDWATALEVTALQAQQLDVLRIRNTE